MIFRITGENVERIDLSGIKECWHLLFRCFFCAFFCIFFYLILSYTCLMLVLCLDYLCFDIQKGMNKMEIVKGAFSEAKIFTDQIEEYAKAQIQMICDNPVSQDSKIRIMPDVHPGNVGTVGLTMTVKERMIPNLLGIDIGCGVSCVKVKGKKIELQKLDTVIRERIPVGFQIREGLHTLAEAFRLDRLCCFRHVNEGKALLSLGTLGGGNHFIEADRDEEGQIYLTVHSGSRHLGKEVTDFYIKEGAKRLKAQKKQVPYPLTWIEGDLMREYMADVKVVQEFAALNREIILAEILKGMKWKEAEWISSVHNYLESNGEESILRKGAISARQGEAVVIPVNMRDGIILGVGKGNPDWNESAPHGSGRRMRRDEVKKHYTVSAFKKEMKGIYSSCISADTLEEAPFAYRSLEEIVGKLEETVEIKTVLKPVYNFK